MATITENMSNRLFHYFCNIEDDLKPKIKEIITMAAKNLVDLTTCLILTHEKITNDEFKHLDILNRLAQPLHKWHDDLISGALATRRNISRLMSDIKYLIGNIDEADDLFLELDTIAKPSTENWTSKMSFKTGENLRKILLDLILIVDPKISGITKNSESEASLINQRISEMTSSSKEFLSLQTFKASIKEIKEEDEDCISKKMNKGSQDNLMVFSTKKKHTLTYGLSGDLQDLDYIQEELKLKNLQTIENIHQIQQLKNLKYFHEINAKCPTQEDLFSGANEKNSAFIQTNLMEPETEISPVKVEEGLNNLIDKPISGRTTKKNSNKKMKGSNNYCTNQTLNKEIREPSFPNSKTISGMVSCRSSKKSIKSIKSNYEERMNMIESIQSQIMEHPPKINTDRGPLNEVYDTNGRMKTKEGVEGEHESLVKSGVLQESFSKFPKHSDVIPENTIDENLDESNYQFTKTNPVVPRLPIEKINNTKKEKENNASVKYKQFQNNLKKASKNSKDLEGVFKPQELNRNFNFSNHTFKGNSPICSLGKLKNLSKKSSNKDIIKEEEKKDVKNNLFSINTSQALSTIRDETDHFINTNRSINLTQEDSKLLQTKSPTIHDKSIKETNRDNSIGFEGDSTPDRVMINGNNVFARSPLDSNRKSKTKRSKGKFDIDRYMANRNSEVIHVGIKGSQKVEISPDGKYAFFGGEGLNVLELKNGEYRMIKKDKKKSNLFF